MIAGLLLTSLLMGLAGGPHCVAMCGAASAGLGCTPRRLALFQAARITGYALLGMMVASSAALLAWGAGHIALLKPFWAMLHLALVALGLSLLWLGRQPAWLDRAAHRVWQALRLRTLGFDGGARLPALATGLAGLVWALLPCGLLYSALMVASLSPQPWQGGLVMAAFGLGSAVSLHLGAKLWLRALRSGSDRSGRWGVRLAGAAVAGASAWALGHGLWNDVARLVC